MSLESLGQPRLPTGRDIERAARAEVEGRIRGEVQKHVPGLPNIPTSPEQAFKMGANELAKRFGLPGIPTSPEQIPKAIAERIVKELNIPIPTKLSVDGLLSAARGLPIKLPFPLPTKLPTTAKEFLEVGLELGARIFGPQVLAAVGLGAAVPGIGWAVSIGTVLVSFLSQFFGKVDPKARYWCAPDNPRSRRMLRKPTGNEFTTRFQESVSKATPVLQMAWYQAALSEAQGVRRNPAYMKEFRPSMVNQCITAMQEALRRRIYPLVRGTTGGTLAEVQYALAMFNWVKQAYPNVPMERESISVYNQLNARMAQLNAISASYNAVMTGKLPTATAAQTSQSIGQLMLLINKVLGEMRTAATATQASQTNPFWYKQNLANFALATAVYSQLDAKKNELIAKMNMQQGRKPLPRTEAGLKEQQFRFEFSGCGGNAACEAKIRAKYGKAPAPAPRPAAAPAPRAPTAPAPRPTVQQMQQTLLQWKQWLKAAHAAQVRRAPVPPPPPLPKLNPPGTPPAWAVWMNRVRQARRANQPPPFPPAIPAAWVR